MVASTANSLLAATGFHHRLIGIAAAGWLIRHGDWSC